MRKAYLLCFLLLIFMLSGCSEKEKTVKFNVPKEISNIVISGEGTEVYFSGDKDINKDKNIVLDDTEAVEIVVNALKQGTPPSTGAMTTEGPSLQINLIYKDNTQDTFDFWFRPEEKTGRFEDNDGRVFMFKKQDISKIETLLRKNAEKK
ncbi:hypothetical protein M3172_24640 [Mesobacillus subterraneus]|uniref:hypothetical protein n=1 Tax=Mesobacillus subterraneus TaxID=285983 RepID=UPI0020415491|nr:hypothetical protein [Mesobacillus subterraneus]MCM3576359.1 hypothetical protein [Mesobacillus subterraneus]